MAIEVLGAVGPPDRATLTQGNLDVVDGCSCPGESVGIPASFGSLYCTTRIHECANKLQVSLRREIRVSGAPEPSADDDVTLIGSEKRFHIPDDSLSTVNRRRVCTAITATS